MMARPLLARRLSGRREHGSMSVELVVIAPGLIGLLLLVGAGGRVVEAQGHLDGAARDAARAASLVSSPDAARRRPAGVPLSELESGSKATVLRITEEAEEDAGLLSYLEARALTPGAHVTILARSESLDSLTLEGPRGRATLGLRPAALIRMLPGTADPELFHKVPAPLAS